MKVSALAVAGALLAASVAWSESAEDYRRAAEAGDRRAQSRLALMYRAGREVSQSDAEAFRWFREAALAGDAAAQHYLGLFYLGGVGTDIDLDQASLWLRRCAEINQPETLLSLVWFALEEGWLPHGAVHTAALLRNAAEQGYSAASYALGFSRLGHEAMQQADPGLQQSAERGTSEVQFQLGMSLLAGRAALTRSEEAVVWFRRAAAQGDARAMRSLGVAHLTGRGAPEDAILAYEWFRLAERHGSAVAGRDADHLEALVGREMLGLERGREQARDLDGADPQPEP